MTIKFKQPVIATRIMEGTKVYYKVTTENKKHHACGATVEKAMAALVKKLACGL